MYGQGYRNKAERKSNSRFVVSEKNKPGYGQKKRADTPKMKSESQVVVDVRRIGLEKKLDALVLRELYGKSKTALTEEEREKARQEYLDRRGIPNSFRW